jgi:hypothetical protein
MVANTECLPRDGERPAAEGLGPKCTVGGGHGTLTVVGPGAALQLMGMVGCVLIVADMEH